MLLTQFLLLSAALFSIGVYGVIAYDVLQRTREIGIRVALGASRGAVLSLMLRRGLTMIAVGSGIGLVAATALTRPFSSLLFEVSPRDVAVFASVAALLGAAGALASYVPSWRATRIHWTMSATRITT